MYTRCPYCHTYFKVLAEHLKKAGGQVRCGQCYKVFNSIGNLIEKLPVPLSEKLTEKRKHKPEFTAPLQKEVQEPEPQQQPAINARKPEPAPTSRLFDDNAGIDQETAVNKFDFDVDSQATEPSMPEPAMSEHEPHFRLNRAAKSEFKRKKSIESIILSKKDRINNIHTGPNSPNKELMIHPTFGVSEEEEFQHNIALYWGIGLFALLGIFIIQYSFFYRGELAQHAILKPWIVTLCNIGNCEIPTQRDIRAIKLVRRDITTHPKVNNALLISAALINESKNVQPFPIMRIQLSDTVGQILASRRFNPNEYMDADINLRKGMPPGNPIQINLEILDPGKSAVNFEFDFFYPEVN